MKWTFSFKAPHKEHVTFDLNLTITGEKGQMLHRIGLSVFLALWVSLALAQPPVNDECVDALTLCAGQPLSADNTGSLGGPGFCPDTDVPLWYSFTTNSVGGDATFSISSLNCAVAPGFDDEISLVVLSGNGSCVLSNFTAVAPCTTSNVDFDLTVTGLMPNTLYWVLVSGVQDMGASSPANCLFDLSMSGPGVDIVDVDFDAGQGFEIQSGETVQLQGSGPGPNWNWSPTAGLSGNNIPDPFSTPSFTTVYTLSEIINDCLYSDTVVVEVVRLVDPPNTFTPNGDGFNDTWEIPGISAYPNAEILVFDRWGQKVFGVNGYSEQWDGTRNGKALSTGTFYYHIKLNRIEGQVPPITGSVSIVK